MWFVKSQKAEKNLFKPGSVEKSGPAMFSLDCSGFCPLNKFIDILQEVAWIWISKIMERFSDSGSIWLGMFGLFLTTHSKI